MTKKQYKRWREFSILMAQHAYPKATENRRAKIEKNVRIFFDVIEYQRKDIESWDGPKVYVGDRVSDIFDSDFYHEREFSDGRFKTCDNKFLNQISCCIRAGLDVASEPSAGVVGFTMGDLRRMYPDGLPKWLRKYLKSGRKPPKLHKLADDVPVWL